MNFSDNIIFATQLSKIDRLIVVNVINNILDILNKLVEDYVDKSIRIIIRTNSNTTIYFNSLDEFCNNCTNLYQIDSCEISLFYYSDSKPSLDDILSLINFDIDHITNQCKIRVALSSKSKTFNEDVLMAINKSLEIEFPTDEPSKVELPMNVCITTSPEEREHLAQQSKRDKNYELRHLVLGCILTALLSFLVGKLL